MKKILLYIVLFSVSTSLAQRGVGIGTTNPDASAILQIDTTTQGFLISRVSLSNVTNGVAPINTPATGLLVYNTNAGITGGNGTGFYYWNGAQWVNIGGSVAGWDLLGNAGTSPATNFLGTTNGQDLVISANGTEVIRVQADQDIGIGTTNPTAALHIEGTAVSNLVYQMDFDADTSSVSFNNSGGAWSIGAGTGPECNTACNDNRGFIDTTDDGTNSSMTLGPFVPSQATINVSFNYGHDQIGGGGGRAGDRFRVELLQGAAVVQTFVNLVDTDSFDQTFTIAGVAVTAGLNYSLRFVQEDRFSSSVDNVLVTQTPIPVLRIDDGNQQQGYVLTSDPNGYASWRPSQVSFAEDDWAFFSGSTNTDPIYHEGPVRAGNTALATHTLSLDYSTNAQQSYVNATAFGLGSVEIFASGNGSTEMAAINNDLAPQVDNTNTLGSAARAWTEVFLVNGTIVTSDEKLKENMQPIAYGIDDVMKLKPSQYYWKDNMYKNRGIPLEQRRHQLGLVAQDLLEVVPEVVVTHQWVRDSEDGRNKFVLKENERLGVNYAELIPVLVKATQDQQKLIEKLKEENEKLEKLLEDK